MRRAIVAAVLMSCLSAPAFAKKVVFVESSPVADKPSVKLDPAKAYVLVRTEVPVPMMWIKDPSPEDLKTYNEMRAKALAKAKAKYVADARIYPALVKAGSKVEKPVEPTEENFQFTPFAALANVVFGPAFRFAKKDDGASTYLQEITPGTYSLYALGLSGNVQSICFCMGSLRFDVAAGEVVDLGRIGVDTQEGDTGREKVDRQTDDNSVPPSTSFRLTPATADMEVDPRLAAAHIRPAAYRPAGKVPNFLGVIISRLPETPGVVRYERDHIIDLTAAPASIAGQ